MANGHYNSKLSCKPNCKTPLSHSEKLSTRLNFVKSKKTSTCYNMVHDIYVKEVHGHKRHHSQLQIGSCILAPFPIVN